MNKVIQFFTLLSLIAFLGTCSKTCPPGQVLVNNQCVCTYQGPTPVFLGAASSFAILSETGITDVPASAVTGNVGSSPITGAAILISCPEVTGNIYAVDAAGPAPCAITNPSGLSIDIANMCAAYEDAAGRISPNFLNLGAGLIGGSTLTPGLYTWISDVLITSSVTLSGGPNDVWIFQMTGDLLQSSGTHVNLIGGANANNVFWQVAGAAVTISSGATFAGTILAKNLIALQTGASVVGRLLAQTAVTLQQNTVVLPAPGNPNCIQACLGLNYLANCQICENSSSCLTCAPGYSQVNGNCQLISDDIVAIRTRKQKNGAVLQADK